MITLAAAILVTATGLWLIGRVLKLVVQILTFPFRLGASK